MLVLLLLLLLLLLMMLVVPLCALIKALIKALTKAYSRRNQGVALRVDCLVARSRHTRPYKSAALRVRGFVRAYCLLLVWNLATLKYTFQYL